MKLSKVLVAMSLVASANAFAVDGDHDGDETANLECHVYDASGAELAQTSASVEVTGETTVYKLEGELFSARVDLADGLGLLQLVDKRSGDKVKVEEGDFDIGEKVAVTLETDEAPEAALTLSCLGK